MKQYIKTVWVLAIAVLFTIPYNNAKAQPRASVSFQMFYDELSPYGRWIDAPGQGYVWVPNAGNDFRPYYSSGHWVMTEYGNTWVSDYDWGWAPFHYGRWTNDPYYGWMWIPDTEWGPAWVSWRNGGGYYGWAPMAPGISINVAIGPRYTVANDWWVFIPNKYIYNPRFHQHYRGPRYNTTIINQTTIINNTYVYNNHRYISGPRRDDVERRTGQRVVTYDVRDNNRPGRSNVQDRTVDIYRPRVEQRKDNTRPQHAVNAERPIQSMDRNAVNNRIEQRNPVDRPVQNDRVRQTQPDRVAQAPEQRNQANNGNVRMQQQNERNEQARQQREASDRNMQDRNRVAEQRQNADVQKQRQVQQRAEQQQRIEQNRQQHWERRQETEQRPQRAEQQAPQRTTQPQNRQETRQAPSRGRSGR
jgi:hypothetical protein